MYSTYVSFQYYAGSIEKTETFISVLALLILPDRVGAGPHPANPLRQHNFIKFSNVSNSVQYLRGRRHLATKNTTSDTRNTGRKVSNAAAKAAHSFRAGDVVVLKDNVRRHVVYGVKYVNLVSGLTTGCRPP